MKMISTALAAAGLLALSACGGSESGSANGVDEVNVATDNLTATDTLDVNALGTDANALGTDTNLTTSTDANLATGTDANLTGTTDTGNTAGGNSATTNGL